MSEMTEAEYDAELQRRIDLYEEGLVDAAVDAYDEETVFSALMEDENWISHQLLGHGANPGEFARSHSMALSLANGVDFPFYFDDYIDWAKLERKEYPCSGGEFGEYGYMYFFKPLLVDNDWQQERAMQAGMAFGCQGYNDAMGY